MCSCSMRSISLQQVRKNFRLEACYEAVASEHLMSVQCIASCSLKPKPLLQSILGAAAGFLAQAFHQLWPARWPVTTSFGSLLERTAIDLYAAACLTQMTDSALTGKPRGSREKRGGRSGSAQHLLQPDPAALNPSSVFSPLAMLAIVCRPGSFAGCGQHLVGLGLPAAQFAPVRLCVTPGTSFTSLRHLRPNRCDPKPSATCSAGA